VRSARPRLAVTGQGRSVKRGRKILTSSNVGRRLPIPTLTLPSTRFTLHRTGLRTFAGTVPSRGRASSNVRCRTRLRTRLHTTSSLLAMAGGVAAGLGLSFRERERERERAQFFQIENPELGTVIVATRKPKLSRGLSPTVPWQRAPWRRRAAGHQADGTRECEIVVSDRSVEPKICFCNEWGAKISFLQFPLPTINDETINIVFQTP